MKVTPLIFILLMVCNLNAQSPYPQDYFISPLDISTELSGSFAELRSNHFHSGIDMKTQQREGLNVKASAEGYISRIKISRWGYGKALYITHPNGYTTVYAHLKSYSPKIDTYIKKAQYQKETYEIELFPKQDELMVSKGEIIALSGNSGSSGGPHLHFEIRNKKQHPINPMYFGIKVPDTQRPVVFDLYAYPISGDAHINSEIKKTKIALHQTSNGNYNTKNISAFGKIGFGIVTYDQHDNAPNKNGVTAIETTFNGSKKLYIDFKSFSFYETKHINRYLDYEHYKTKNSRLQKLFIEPNNPLSIYKQSNNQGYLNIADSTDNIYKISIFDFEGNKTTVNVNISGNKKNNLAFKAVKTYNHYIFPDQDYNLKAQKVNVNFEKNTFYDGFFMNFEVSNDTIKLHHDVVPTKKPFSISFDTKHYKQADAEQLYIAKVVDNYKTQYTPSVLKNNTLTAQAKVLGTYVIKTDSVKPQLKAINFKNNKWLTNEKKLKIYVSDNQSGISNYRATINGKWILMEYQPKKNLLVYNFDSTVRTNEKHDFKLIVVDNVGNSATLEKTFYKK